ncbi:MAG: hypothetical protein IT445_18640 [Phycisphaeraceae bacterium]|nr:hypothetical protein [Phycisphaeraceae bacterium]
MTRWAMFDGGIRMQNVGRILLDSVRQLDAEACELVNGYLSGLVGTVVNRYEDKWSAQLAERLAQHGYETQIQVPYPVQARKRCDVVARLADGSRAWIEVKTAWKSWFSRSEARQFKHNPFYRKYLFGPDDGGLDSTHSLAQDFAKLEELAPLQDHKAILLIGFDAAASPMTVEVDDLCRRLMLNEAGWTQLGPEFWPDRAYESCRICCWFWWHHG